MIAVPKKIKRDSWEHYLFLLEHHNFVWRKTEDPRFIQNYIDNENSIERLRKIFDQRNEMYNQYSPYKK